MKWQAKGPVNEGDVACLAAKCVMKIWPVSATCRDAIYEIIYIVTYMFFIPLQCTDIFPSRK
jgi:hypothetical protein